MSPERWRRLEAIAAVAVGVLVVAYPFTRAEHPPMTDLPFHAAHTSILRHYFDPAFHFREQFVIGALEAPYFLMYAIGAIFALVLPMVIAVKVAAGVMLALLPLGLGVLCHGMKKSPLLGLGALGLVWTTLTHWGFLSSLGAVGLFAMAIGCALLVCDDPTRRRKLALAVTLVALLFTHVFRFPFAVVALALTALVVAPRRWRDLLAPSLPALVLFVVWALVRPPALAPDLSGLAFEPGRLREIPSHVFGAFFGDAGSRERRIGLAFVAVVALVAGIGVLGGAPAANPGFRRRATALLGAIVAMLVVAYLTLPLTMKSWFFVYPREITTAGLILLGALPDLPRAVHWRAPLLAAIVAPAVAMALLVAGEWRRFHEVTADFREVRALVPPAPKLLHLVFDHTGTSRTTTPFIHLPVWIQAEKGGWLYFHFVRWGMYPMRYRFDGGVVPPALPHMLEWEPQRFRVLEQGPWFDTFLVRHSIDPSVLFADDPSIRLVARRGKWWLYRRE